MKNRVSKALLLVLVLFLTQSLIAQDRIMIDFGGTEGNGAGAAPAPWITIDSLAQDEVVDLGDGVTLTALDDGFTANNPAPPGEGAVYDGVVVPQEARDDYLYKNIDTAGTEARMRIDGLAAGEYNITVFEGRMSDVSQFAKIWTGDEPSEENTGTFAAGSATISVTVAAGQTLWYKHLEDNSGGISGMIIRRTVSNDLAFFQIDFGGEEGNGAGAAPSPWVTIDSLDQDEVVNLGDGVTLTALDDGYTANNPAPPNEDAEYDGVIVPQEARNDYLYKNIDTGGTEARMRIDGLPAGSYNISVFEGRTSDASQFAKIWTGDEPAAENSGDFAGGGVTVSIDVAAGEPLWYKHLEDGSGGVSGMIIRQTAAAALAPIQIDFGGTEGNGAGAAATPWFVIDSLDQDETVDLGGGVILTALDDGYTPNNPAPPGEGAVYDGIIVPQEARDDYLYKNADTAGTEARLRLDGLPSGTYNVTVFEGRTSDVSQFAKIWVGQEPASENTGSFAGGSATVTVELSAGQTLWYKHLEDGSGGISGMIIRQTDVDGERAFLGGAFGAATGFTSLLSGATDVDPESVTAMLNGESIDVTATKEGSVIRISHSITNTPLAPDVEHTVRISWTSSSGARVSQSAPLNVPFYGHVEASLAVADANTATGGFLIQTVQSESNLATNTNVREQHLAGLIGGENIASDFGAENGFWTHEFINLDDFGGSSGEFTFIGDGTSLDVLDDPTPGIPGFTLSSDNFTTVIYTIVRIPESGIYTFGANSDDGFKVTFGNDAGDSVYGGGVDGGGIFTTDFDVYFDAPGDYGMRTIWYDGTGGGYLELYSYVGDDKVLLNDTGNGGLQTFAALPNQSTRIVSALPSTGSFQVEPDSDVYVQIHDGSASVDQDSIALVVNGEVQDAVVQTIGGVTSVTVDRSGLLWESGEEITAELSYVAGGETRDASWHWTVIDFVTLPTIGHRSDVGTGVEPGFAFRVHQIDTVRANSTPEAEAQLAGERGANLANSAGGRPSNDPSRAGTVFDLDGVINMDQNSGSVGYFRATGDGSLRDRADGPIPGIPGTTGNTDNIAAEILTYVEFPEAGYHRMVFNSDDGFRVTVGHEPGAGGIELGVFNGGRGASDTIFGFAVAEPGLYPLRAIWYEGGGGANLEWSSFVGDDRILINDSEGGLKAYRTRDGAVDQGAAGRVSSITRSDDVLIIEFTGVLKSSDTVNGPYEPVAGAMSPFSVTPDAGQRFFIAQ